MATPGSGLFLPTVPLAWALQAGGHDVLVANNRHAASVSARAGLCAVDPCPERDVFAEFMTTSRAINSTPPGQPRPARGGLGLFGEEMAEGLLAVARRFRPDLILSTLEQGAGPLVAAALGVPHVEQSVRLAWAGSDPQACKHRRRIAEYLEPTRSRLGIPRPSPAVATIDVRPPSLGGRESGHQWLARYIPYNEARVLPAWLLDTPAAPRVCVSLGTVVPVAGHLDGLREVLLALAATGCEVIVTLEPGLALFDDMPAVVHPVGWLPLNVLLPTCAAILHHGGAGTSLTAFTCGIPQLVVPQNADQPANADVIVRRGAGVRCDLGAVDARELGEALKGLLADRTIREAADSVREEIGAQPALHDVVARLEVLIDSRPT